MFLDAHLNGFLTNGKFDNSKFRSFYNLQNNLEDVKKKPNDDFASVSTLLLTEYTKILKDYENSENIKSLIVQMRKLMLKFKTTIDCNAYAVSI